MILVTILVLGGLLYLFAARITQWPIYRSIYCLLGILCAVFAVKPHTGFVTHMWGHLLLGMLAPLLMVLSRPVTLALRTIPAPWARQLTRLMKSRAFGLISDPVTASILNIGGLWLLYTTSLYAHMHHHTVLYELVHLHVWLAGYFFTASMITLDPKPHPRSFVYRSVVLVIALAAHGILAKYIYAHPPLGVSVEEAERGAMIMYYGGDLIDLALMVIFCHQWYKVTRPRVIKNTEVLQK
ncbi:cytochrome c oxidase assembly protein [Ammoniphilus sp. YIM 78166]|uniref:cytochrome c oxidase assembly protein n=1 Tax=Ammoniphilus sp. YIM 78166 TaxID=1644106 RepID=UPI00106FA3D5|nr:cytochrome c oxidase assembly protein [Ammoniphilus sp. YIM 78166]